MNRLQFGLTLFAAGFCLAFQASSLTTQREPVWDPQEAQSSLFTQQANAPVPRDLCVDTRTTVSRWQRSRPTRLVDEIPSTTREPRGARVSLVSFAAMSSTYQDCAGPDNNVAVSIQAVGGNNQKCSTAGAGNYPNGSTCSVTAANNGGTTLQCSTVAGQTYCSTNVSNGAGPSTCSTSGAAGPQPSENACSTANGGTCSTQANTNQQNGNTTYNCSAGLAPGSTQTTCSSNTSGGVGGGDNAGFCSATAGNIQGGTQTNKALPTFEWVEQ